MTVPQMQKSVSAWMGRPSAAAEHADAAAAECAGECEFGHSFGQRQTAASIIAGGPPTKMFTRNGLPARRAAAWWTPIERWI